jgi:non-heme chloroperoxidase
MGQYVEVEKDVKVFVTDVGPKDGRPIVFLHGWPMNHRQFEYQYDQLPKAGYRCIGVDFRGFGKSDKPFTGYSYDRLADDVRVIIDELELKNIVLLGHSMGGAVAIRYMARHQSHEVYKLALLAAAAPVFTQPPDASPKLTNMTKQNVDQLIHQTYSDRPEMLSSFGNMFFFQYITESFRTWFLSLGLVASGNATAKAAISLRDEVLWQDLPKINVPTGLFWGVHDQICPLPIGETLNNNIKDSKLIPFYYSGHGAFYCELNKMNYELVHFIQES